MSREPAGRSGVTLHWLTRRLDIVVLAVLAYVPALASSPGRMPADTKLYLYTDPGGLLGRAASTFEPDQFAGWVPHQQITYLWPSGPWFWLFETLAVPDWIAHRLWIGTIMFAAGLGARQCARLLGHSGAPVLAAATVYQLSPLLLPYVSRTSLLLLPWAGLGWIVAATVRASRPEGRPASWFVRWREPAIIALIVATVGSVNATALAMIVPAPAIWLVYAAVCKITPIGQIVRLAFRVGVACVTVSLWWIAMLVVQSRSGAPVLLYSETLEDVSRNSTGSEVLRGLGYWLFYGRDAFSATTTSSLSYLTRTGAILISFTLPIMGLAGLAFGRSTHRRFAAALTVVGMIVAVGVHPLGDSSLLVRLLTGDNDTGLALALRSSTRALPVMVLGLALGTAALVERLPVSTLVRQAPTGLTWRRVAAGAVVFVAVVNMPALWKAQVVDPAIDRDSDLPQAWTEAAARLDAQPGDTRVMQLPGAEFGAFDWGFTVDQPLVSATDRAVVTRDLLPLGAPAAMDLLYAFDDRVQTGVLEPASVSPIARLFAVGTIWLANDIDSLRFRTPPAGSLDAVMAAAPGIESPESFGQRSATVQMFDLFGRPLVDADSIGEPSTQPASVSLLDVDDALEVTRVKTDVVIVSGSGDGLVDAAAAGLIDGSELIRYGTGTDAIGDTDRVIITDSNRDRARHWRSSQDVTGLTEPGGPGSDVLVDTAADQRLDPLGTQDDARAQTIAMQRGPVMAIASDYGEPFAYRPEDRAVMAIDGDLATAWSVGDHGDPVGALLRLTTAESVSTLVLHQLPAAAGGRQISSIDITTGGRTQSVNLTSASFAGSGQTVVLDHPATGTIDIEITAVTLGDVAQAASRTGVGFVEIDTGLGATTEFVRPPIDTLERLSPDRGPLDIVFTRDRVEATSFWRSDPEPVLRRLLPLTSGGTFDVDVTVRLDQRATDAELAAVIGDEGAVANRRLPGVIHRGSAAVDGDLATTWLTPIDDAVGATLAITESSGPVTALDLVQPVGAWSTITQMTVAGSGGEVRVDVAAPDAAGRSSVPIQAGLIGAGESFSLTITAIEPVTSAERRYGDTITMPAGIAELTGSAGITAPASNAAERVVTRGCDDPPHLSVDDTPLRTEFSATVEQLLSGRAAVGTSCAGPLDLHPGDHTIVAASATDTGFTVDRVVLSTSDRPAADDAGATGAAMVTVRKRDTQHRTVELDCPAGCWLVFGMGHNPAWAATGPMGDLGAPVVVDGGFNGWYIGPSSGRQTVTIRWTEQRPVTFGLIASLLAVLACCAAVAASRRRRRTTVTNQVDGDVHHDDDDDDGEGEGDAQQVLPSHSAAVWGKLGIAAGAVALTVTPLGGLAVFAIGACEVLVRRWFRPVSLTAIAGLAAAAFVAASVAVIERRDTPFPDAGWTTLFDHLNALAISAVALVAVSTLLSPRQDVSTSKWRTVSSRRSAGPTPSGSR